MTTLEELKKLPIEERLRLVEDLWDSIAEKEEALPEESPEFIAEILRRADEYRANPSIGIPWEGAEARIEKRRRG